MSESVIMDKACRELTRDYGKIISFIQKESDSQKKEDLFTLWHSIKYFCDVYDGADSIVRAERAYAKHVVHVYEKILRQQNGRKLLIVAMAGITSPDALYYGVWGTVRGISTAQMQVLEIYLDKMRIQATEIPPEIENTTMDDEDEDDDDTVDAVADAGDTDTVNNNTDEIGGDDGVRELGPVDQNENATIAITDADTATVTNAAITRGGIDVDIAGLEEFRKLSIDDLVDRVVMRTQQILADQEREAETAGAKGTTANDDVVMESADEAPRENKTDAIGRSMDDSGVVSIASQILPKPNVTIDVLDDNPVDDFSEDSWFDDHANAILQSTPSVADQPAAPPARGKITIDLNEKDYTLYCEHWKVTTQVGLTKLRKIHFSNFGYLQRFIYDTVKGPTATVWFSKGRQLTRTNYRHGNNDNFPNFDLKDQTENVYPKPRQVAPIHFDRRDYCNHSPVRLALTAQQRRAHYRRQNATRQRSPNVRNLRLHNRSGSRGSVNASIDSINETVAIENLPNESFPEELEKEVQVLRKRIQRLESKLRQ